MATLNNEQLRQYLLGFSPASDSVKIEEQWFTDDGAYEELLAAEAELVDEYVAGSLTTEERERFLSRFLVTDERREKLRFSQAFKAALNKTAEPVSITPQRERPSTKWYQWFIPASPRIAYAAAAIVLVAVLGISWLAFRNSGSPSGEISVFAVTLRPGLTRGGDDIQRVTVPGDKNVVRFQVELPRPHRSYQAELLSEGKTVMVVDRLSPVTKDNRAVIDVDIPSEKVPPGDYRLRLNGMSESGALEPAGTYAFRITR